LLTAMAGRPSEARALLADADRISTELALEPGWSTGAQLELLADDPVAAERKLRRELMGLPNQGIARSFCTALLAETAYRKGHYSEAERLAAIARTEAGGHFYVAVLSRRVEAKSLARRGQTHTGEQLAREAVSLTEPTEWLNLRAGTLLDLAEILRLD